MKAKGEVSTNNAALLFAVRFLPFLRKRRILEYFGQVVRGFIYQILQITPKEKIQEKGRSS